MSSLIGTTDYVPTPGQRQTVIEPVPGHRTAVPKLVRAYGKNNSVLTYNQDGTAELLLESDSPLAKKIITFACRPDEDAASTDPAGQTAELVVTRNERQFFYADDPTVTYVIPGIVSHPGSAGDICANGVVDVQDGLAARSSLEFRA